MSKAASTRDTPRPTAGPLGPAGLLESLTPLLHEWLPRQRWFAGKGRPVTAFALIAVTELLPASTAASGLLHLLVQAQQDSPARARPTGDCYQLLLGVRSALPPRLAAALIGRVPEGPLAGSVVYDALLDPRLAGVLFERLRTPGRLGALRFDRNPSVLLPAGLTARPLGVEQSNTSLVYGDTFILKVFRRVHPGSNPDLELPLALAQAGCARVPAPVAWYETTEPEPATLGVLQPFLYGSDDGWQLALHALADNHDFTEAARTLGRATAEVHRTLASALPTAVLRKQQIQHLAAEMTERLEATAQAVPALAPYVSGLRTAFDAVAELGHAGRTWAAQRIHGDLHLGQSLRAGDGEWSVIDFEGEPARPLAERTRPQPVVRDVAGMLRSFDYAARSHRPWSPQWATHCRDAYCDGYASVAGADPRGEPELLRAYETDKAVYEVLYEARNRPDWLPVPMAAVERLSHPFPAPDSPTPAPKLPRRPPQ